MTTTTTTTTTATTTTSTIAIEPLNSPEPGKPMHHDLRCGVCGAPFSHTSPWMTRCGLCRMDAVNASYRDRYRRRLV